MQNPVAWETETRSKYLQALTQRLNKMNTNAISSFIRYALALEKWFSLDAKNFMTFLEQHDNVENISPNLIYEVISKSLNQTKMNKTNRSTLLSEKYQIE